MIRRRCWFLQMADIFRSDIPPFEGSSTVASSSSSVCRDDAAEVDLDQVTGAGYHAGYELGVVEHELDGHIMTCILAWSSASMQVEHTKCLDDGNWESGLDRDELRGKQLLGSCTMASAYTAAPTWTLQNPSNQCFAIGQKVYRELNGHWFAGGCYKRRATVG